MKTLMLEELLYQLVVEGGAIVTSNECSQIEIADAQATGRWAVDHEGIGYVRRYREWLERHKTCVSKAPDSPSAKLTDKIRVSRAL